MRETAAATVDTVLAELRRRPIVHPESLSLALPGNAFEPRGLPRWGWENPLKAIMIQWKVSGGLGVATN
jgi:hypothetical protein